MREQEAAEKTAKKAAAAVARDERDREEVADAYAVGRDLIKRLDDPVDPLNSVEALKMPELKALLIMHGVAFKKSGPDANKASYVVLVKRLNL